MSPHRGARKFYLPGNCAEDLGAGRRAERGQVEIDHRANTHKKKEITFCGGVGFKHEASSKRFQEAMIVSVAVCLARERVPPLATPSLSLSLSLFRVLAHVTVRLTRQEMAPQGRASRTRQMLGTPRSSKVPMSFLIWPRKVYAPKGTTSKQRKHGSSCGGSRPRYAGSAASR